jgi:chromosome segregation ATPase
MAIESEKRFKRALDLLDKNVKKQQGGQVKKVHALEEQNNILQQGLDALKQDYEKMEDVFISLKEEIKAAQIKASQEKAASEAKAVSQAEATSAGGADKADIAALTGERDALKEELAMTRNEHQSLEDSFSALKRQYAEVEEDGQKFYDNVSNSNAGVVSEKEFESLTAERDSLAQELEKIKEIYVMQLAENELLLAEASGVSKTKENLKESLDRSIEKLEQLNIN